MSTFSKDLLISILIVCLTLVFTALVQAAA
jgi:hypothetical protein